MEKKSVKIANRKINNMVLNERNSEIVRNGRRSRGPSPNGVNTGTHTPESSDDDNCKFWNFHFYFLEKFFSSENFLICFPTSAFLSHQAQWKVQDQTKWIWRWGVKVNSWNFWDLFWKILKFFRENQSWKRLPGCLSTFDSRFR